MLFEGMELLEPTLATLPNGMQVMKLAENGISGLFAASPTTTPQLKNIKELPVDRVKRLTRRRRPTWDEQGKVPPWKT